MSFLQNVMKKIKKHLASRSQYIAMLRDEGVIIGEECDIDKEAFLGSEPYLIKIGNNTRITRGVHFITHDGGVWTLRKMGLLEENAVKYGNIVIGDNCNIGWNTIIMPNVHIGNNVVIAAGSVVTKNIPDNTVYGGIPAREIENIYDYYDKNKGLVVPTNSMSPQEKKTYLLNEWTHIFGGGMTYNYI